ncbi:MAG: RNA polymerase subunit sigma-70 [Synechococcaceae cyanobacterium SM2_3_2]|nr:RNA polymerase subunit sigma-70 [Synechococcaceae cyanobacterium SM2_3_2]
MTFTDPHPIHHPLDHPETDFELLCQMQTRERRAYFLLKDRYRDRILSIARSLLAQPHQADEVVRQVFEQSWRQADSFDLRRDRSVALWLYALARSYALPTSPRWPWQRPQSAERRGFSTQGSPWLINLLALGVVGLGISTGISLWRWHQLSGLLARISLPEPGASVDLQATYQQWQHQADIRRLTLRDPQLQSGTLAQLLWSPSENRALLLGTQIPTVHPGLTYQLWTRSADPNQALSVGTFMSATDGTVQWLSDSFAPTLDGDPQHFWVTLEPLGGSSNPTGLALLESRPY